ncbi:MAG TPA: hypothetical protein VFZ34_30240 [Blastocatellia bacterium]|nr:hypothetical protein [Blastocatellia bacterium]
MKKTSSTKTPPNESEEMLAEYKFDYSKARPNRFAGRINKDRVVVMLDADVAEVFTTPEAVNTVLRAVVAALPQNIKRKTSRK